ncbi:MAG: thermonuclease family protein [Chromatiales bacterium]|nr:thermonuclease family protein [Chromatiales bacterium]
MINKILILSLLLALPLTLQAETASYPLVDIIDGDTLLVSIDGKQHKIQLLGIDAPEDVDNAKLKHDIGRTGLSAEQLLPLGKLATDFLKQQLSPNASVTLEGKLAARDRYSRIPAVVMDSEGQNINALMVAEGYAVVLGRYPLAQPLKQTLQTQEQSAMQEQQGLWGSHRQLMRQWSGKGDQ